MFQPLKSIKNVAEVKPYSTAPEAFQALSNGTVDAVVNDNVTSLSIILNSPNLNLAVVGQPFTQEYYGMAVRKECPDLLAKINRLGRLPNANHAAFWAGLAPGKNESAGRNRSAKTRQPTAISNVLWSRLLTLPVAARTTICQRNTLVWPLGVAKNGLL